MAMMSCRLSLEERNRLLRLLQQADATSRNSRLPEAERDLWDERCDELEEHYYKGLIRPVSRCPYDGELLYRSIDLYGLDGSWWYGGADKHNPPGCRHFCVMRGGVCYGDVAPPPGQKLSTGPEVPYVMPLLMEHPDMQAVISSFEMEPGYVAYVIAHFAERRPPAEKLTCNWPDTRHHYTTELGQRFQRADTDLWDFELRPWLKIDRIRWIEPGSSDLAFSERDPDLCPYVDLTGHRGRVEVYGQGMLRKIAPPSGIPVYPD